MNNENNANNGVIDTLTFIGFEDTVVSAFKKGFADSDIDLQILNGMTLVSNETCLDNLARSSSYGCELALEELKANPAKRVTLLGFLPKIYLQNRKPEFSVLENFENFRFLDLPTSPQAIVRAWENETQKDLDLPVITKYLQQQVSMIMHTMHGQDPLNPQSEDAIRSVPALVRNARKVFPSLSKLTDQEVVEFMVAVDSNREEVRKGERLEGVFCDVEGTLLEGGNVNIETLELLEKYETDGKKITLWTDGDIDSLRTTLQSHGVNYPLHSKSEYAGAVVEIAIDDLDQFAFSAKTKILPEKFVRIM
jgi:hypothetical protein